jgi:metacaspase-1
MAQGMALTIGLNAVDPQHYAGWSGELVACEADATDMAQLAKSKGFSVETLYTGAATRDNVSGKITRIAQTLKSGDIFLLTYSGHGGQLPDLNGDEPDGKDETWCLFDGELVDDEIYGLLGKFQPGVRILVFSDSCHSGTVLRAAYYAGMARPGADGGTPQKTRYRFMPKPIGERTYLANQDFYERILRNPQLKEAKGAVKASALLISGCQDNQTSADGDFNGLFTGTMLHVWNGGKFKKGYRAFCSAIGKLMPPDQSPNYYVAGEINRTFEKQRPFTI